MVTAISATMPRPRPIDAITADHLTLETVEDYKHPDCTSYNKCLDVAIRKDWAGFDCKSCSAYIMIGQEQLELDYQGLIVILKASENVEKRGNCERRRGVKPGAKSTTTVTTKKRVRLPIIAERLERLQDDINIEQLRRLVIA